MRPRTALKHLTKIERHIFAVFALARHLLLGSVHTEFLAIAVALVMQKMGKNDRFLQRISLRNG